MCVYRGLAFEASVSVAILIFYVVQTLIELCVGNYPNQEVIFNRQIMDALNRILQLDIRDTEKHGYTIEDVSMSSKSL